MYHFAFEGGQFLTFILFEIHHVEQKEYEAPGKAHEGHAVGGLSESEYLKDRAANNWSENLTEREECAVQPGAVVTKQLVQLVVLTLSQPLFNIDCIEGIWKQGDKDEALSEAIDGKSNEEEQVRIW